MVSRVLEETKKVVVEIKERKGNWHTVSAKGPTGQEMGEAIGTGHHTEVVITMIICHCQVVGLRVTSSSVAEGLGPHHQARPQPIVVVIVVRTRAEGPK